MTKPKIAFVFSGGGPLGAIQVGYLRALTQREIFPDLLVGTSVGALNAAHTAFHPGAGGVDRLERIWSVLTSDDLFPSGRFRAPWARMFLRCHSVFENSGIQRLITATVGDVSFEEAAIPLCVTATHLETGQEILFTSGPMKAPLLASAAMPGVLPPVEIDGQRYFDGGVVDNIPILPAISLGADVVYVLDASSHRSERRRLERPFDYLMHAFSIARSQRLVIERPHLQRLAKIVSLPKVSLDSAPAFTSMKLTQSLMQRGYDTAARYLEDAAPVEALVPVGA